MTPIRILIEEGDVDAYIDSNGLRYDLQHLEAVVFLAQNTSGGLPTVLLVGEVDGKKRVFKTTLRLYLAAGQAMSGAAERELGPDWRGL